MRKLDLLRATALGAATALAATGASFAQQSVPAEVPPSSYSADQYVDSRGCVFVRVGFGASTEWVPRVGRDRAPICGQSPTRVAGTGAPAAGVSPANPGAGITVIGAAPAAAPSAAPARTVVRAAPAPTGGTALRVLTAPPAAVAPATGTPQSLRIAPGGCTGLTGLTAQYLSGPGERCGPQAVHPGDAARGIVRPGPVFDPASATVPDGYRPAWEDDRTNPLRGVGTYAGDAEMALIWTDTIPRRLVTDEPDRGGLLAFLGTRDPEPAAQIDAPEERAVRTRATRAPVDLHADVEGALAAPEVVVASDHRHVIVGTFGARAEADRAYARLEGAGLPARLGMIERDEGTYFAVTAGPYADSSALVDGLRAAYAAGFSTAVTRR